MNSKKSQKKFNLIHWIKWMIITIHSDWCYNERSIYIKNEYTLHTSRVEVKIFDSFLKKNLITGEFVANSFKCTIEVWKHMGGMFSLSSDLDTWIMTECSTCVRRNIVIV